MPRIPLVALLTAGALLGATACSSSSSDSTASPGGTSQPQVQAAPSAGGAQKAEPVATSSADKALSSDTKAICQQAERTTTSFSATYASDLKIQSTAAKQGAQAQTEAKQRVAQDISSYSYALSDMAKLTDDTKLRAALGEMSKQTSKLGGDASKVSGLSKTLATACS